jgi:hypothetical protein
MPQISGLYRHYRQQAAQYCTRQSGSGNSPELNAHLPCQACRMPVRDGTRPSATTLVPRASSHLPSPQNIRTLHSPLTFRVFRYSLLQSHPFYEPPWQPQPCVDASTFCPQAAACSCPSRSLHDEPMAFSHGSIRIRRRRMDRPVQSAVLGWSQCIGIGRLSGRTRRPVSKKKDRG